VNAELERGRLDPDVAAEFPRLGLLFTRVPARAGRSPAGVRHRLRALSGRVRGPTALTMRQAPVPQAYRVFFRHIGIDPDEQRPPGEAAMVERLRRGSFRSRNLVDDALTLAVVETGVPVWALDAGRVEGRLTLRPGRHGERLGEGEHANWVPEGRLLVADDRGPVAVLFGETAPERWVTKETEVMLLYTVAVPGVPEIHVEEAMATCLDVLTSR
jgi:DNA/RNA-binding domain of Phe-tRNA-synthetase-like protein